MSNEVRIFRFAPDQPGKGGHATGFHGFLPREDTRAIVGFRPYLYTWERDRQATVSMDLSALPQLRSVVSFIEWPRTVIGGNYAQTFLGAGVEYYDSGTLKRRYGWVDAWSGVEVCVSDVWLDTNETAPPPTAAITNDRIVFASHGYPFIWKGERNSGDNSPINSVRLGCPSPTIGPTITVTQNYSTSQYYYGASGSAYICFNLTTSDAAWDGLVAGEKVRLSHESLGAPGYVERTVVSRVSGSTIGGLPGDGPFAFHTNYAGGAKASGAPNNGGGGANDDYISINTTFPLDANNQAPQFIGLRISVAPNYVTDKYIIKKVEYETATTTKVTIMGLLTATYSAAGFSISGVRVLLDSPLTVTSDTSQNANRMMTRPTPATNYFNWSGSEAPGYAYAYYDPLTGHMSNLSPVTYVSQQNVVNGQISISCRQNSTVNCANGDTPVSGIVDATGIQYIGEYLSADLARFSHIVFFRTRRSGGGAVLYPIGSLDPSSANWKGRTGSPATVTSWVDTSLDSDLLISGRVRAPIDTNHRPSIVGPTGTRTRMKLWGMAWWDGRLWVWGPDDRTALHYSCDAAQACMGRPEESFPDSNRLAVPSGAGEITALLTAGAYLIVVTKRGSFIVQGNHETNYRMTGLSAEISNVYTDRLCNIPTGSEGGGVFAAALPDLRILIVTVGGGVEEIGAPIANQLTGAFKGMTFWRSEGSGRLAVVSENVTEGAGVSHVFEYNFSTRTWSRNDPWYSGAMTAGTTAIGTVTPGDFLLPTTQRGEGLCFGLQKRILGVGDTQAYSATTGGHIDLTPLPPAHPGKRIFSFAWARVVLVGPGAASAAAPTFTVSPDDRPSCYFSYTMHEHTDARRKLIDSGAVYDGEAREWVCMGPEWSSSTMDQYQAGQVPTGRRIACNFYPAGGDTVRYRVAYIEVAIREQSEDGSVEP